MRIEVREIGAGEAQPLRHRLLRAHQPPDEAVFPGDEHPSAFHAGAFENDALVGVATIAPDPHPRDPRPGDWRVRGMATVPELRGRGAGLALLNACLEHARAHGGERAWCNARTPAAGFYERAGFAVESQVFDIEGIGPHVVMAVSMPPAHSVRGV